ncbi:MAG: LCP family protein [Clostridia bacterium]|nr:LCP family protein [Clostridia bacterium]
MSNKKSIKDFNIYSKKFYKKGNKTLKRSLAVFFTSLGATLILLVIAGTIILHSFLGQIERNPFDPGNIKIPESAKDVYEGQDVVNIALYGIDSRYVDEPSRSDAIMILTIDRKHKKIKMTSIARDTYVDILGHGKDKITHAYIFGGPELALNSLNSAFNLNITDYVTANFWALAKIIDYVGGVEIDVDSAEMRDLNANYIPYMNKMGITCDYIKEPGLQLLSGGQAVAYCRVRHVGGDVMRGERQREVLMAMYDDVKDLNPLKYPALISLILEECSTSMTNSEILSIATWAATNMNSLKFETLGMPTSELDKGGQMMNGVWYYVYDLEKAAKVIENFILENGDENEQGEQSA